MNSSMRCRSGNASAASERRIIVAAGGFAFDRDGAIVEDSPARDEAVAAIARPPRRARRRGADHRLWPCRRASRATRCRRFAAIASPTVSTDPGRAGPDRPCRFRGARRGGARGGRRGHAASSARATGSRRSASARAPRRLPRANPGRADEIAAARRAAVRRRTRWGELFKVMAIHAPDWPAPAGLRHDDRLSRRRRATMPPRSPSSVARQLRRHLRASLPARRPRRFPRQLTRRETGRSELADPALRRPRRRGGRRAGRLCQARPAALAVRAARRGGRASPALRRSRT